MYVWKDKIGRGADRVAETSGAMNGLLITGQSGFVSGTHVASNLGWRPVEAVSVGDRVLTFDHGMQKIVDIQRETLFTAESSLPEAQRPYLVPKGALNNRSDMLLMPDQGMLVESDAAIDALGDPFAVVPARALNGLNGIHVAPAMDRIEVTTLSFAQDEVIYVEGGMLAHCPRPRCILIDTPTADEPLYDVLNLRAARFLVECLVEENGADAFTCDPEEIAGIAASQPQPMQPSLA